jgi:hypothetical protein
MAGMTGCNAVWNLTDERQLRADIVDQATDKTRIGTPRRRKAAWSPY